MNNLNSSLGNVASVIEEIYNNGRVVPTDEKMVYKDFLQLCYLNFGDVANIQYYKELRAGNQNFYFAKSILTDCFEIEKEDDGRPPFILLNDYAELPYFAGILSVFPKVKSSYRDPDDDYTKMAPGGEKQFAKPKVLDDLGIRFYVPKGDRLELIGGEEEGEVMVEYIALNEETLIPNQLGAVLISVVLKLVMPSKIQPADTHEDTDPNIATYKQRLDQPQGIN